MHRRKSGTQKVEAAPTDLGSILGELDAIKNTCRELAKRTGVVQVSIRTRSADLVKREKAVQQALAGLKQLKNLGA